MKLRVLLGAEFRIHSEADPMDATGVFGLASRQIFGTTEKAAAEFFKVDVKR